MGINLAFCNRKEAINRNTAFAVRETAVEVWKGICLQKGRKEKCFTNEISLASRNRDSSLHTPAHLCRLAKCALPNS